MVTKSSKPGGRKGKKIKVLNLKKETVKDLTRDEGKRVKGGTAYFGTAYCYVSRGISSIVSSAGGSIGSTISGR